MLENHHGIKVCQKKCNLDLGNIVANQLERRFQSEQRFPSAEGFIQSCEAKSFQQNIKLKTEKQCLA